MVNTNICNWTRFTSSLSKSYPHTLLSKVHLNVILPSAFSFPLLQLHIPLHLFNRCKQARIEWNFLRQSAASGCEGFMTFRWLTPFPFSGCAVGFVAPQLMSNCTLCISPFHKSLDAMWPFWLVGVVNTRSRCLQVRNGQIQVRPAPARKRSHHRPHGRNHGHHTLHQQRKANEHTRKVLYIPWKQINDKLTVSPT
jgi:hypothetical protein